MSLLNRYKGRGVLIDTNLLLLYVVGTYDFGLVERRSFNRLRGYSSEDLRLLRGILTLCPVHVTTAHVLAEVSNWIGYLSRDREVECLRSFGSILSDFRELPFDSLEVTTDDRFPFLGLTDSAMARVAADYLILTDDARFVFHLNEMGHEALNINYLRQELWLLQ